MSIGKKIIDLFILLFSILFLCLGIRQFFSSMDKLDVLILKKGMLVTKYDTSFTLTDDKTKPAVILTLAGDTTRYWATRRSWYIDRNLNPGDSILIYIDKPNAGGRTITDDTAIWFSHQPTEIYHLVTLDNNYPVIDFTENQRSLKATWWAFPLASLLFFGWWLYRRSGIKNPLVIETGP